MSVAGPDPDSEISLKPNDQSEEPMHCDAETQVVPERKMLVSRLLEGPKLMVSMKACICVVALLLFMLTIL